MIIVEKKAEGIREETYAQPLLTKHEALHALTGASGKADKEGKDQPD
ncbi:MAG TPA: hypothetical protein VHZ32_05125 [Rhizomicrobium sp.]|jgi:hypothetical protein|nr:hypothetical protein [Rhizomicrobium sp.]